MSEAVYTPLGDGRFESGELSRGPWSPDHQHGGAPAALVAGVIEEVEAPAAMRIARLTLDLVRPVPIAPLQVVTEVTRPGRRVQLVAASSALLGAPAAERLKAGCALLASWGLVVPNNDDLERRWLSRHWGYLAGRDAERQGDLEAADAYGITGFTRFRRILWPTMLRLGWPAYTNEAIFLFHATTLVFFSSFPAFRQQGDALYYANYFADKTYNPFVPYPIVGFYFVCLTLLLVFLFWAVNRRLNRHLPSNQKSRIRLRPQLIR